MGTKFRESASTLLPAAGLVGLVVTWFVLRHGESGNGEVGFLTHDVRNYHFPLYEATWAWIREGRLPAWNPFHLTGIPWLATLQAGVFYPPHWLYLLLPTHFALELNAAFHLAVIAFSMAALAREIGVSRPAAGGAACLFALQGLNVTWLGLPSAMEAGSWLCVGCLGVVRIARGRRVAGARWLALATALSLLAGNPQVTLLGLYAWGSLFLALCWRAGSARVPAAIAAVLAVLVGVSLAGVQMLPAYALSLETARTPAALSVAQLGPAQATLGSLFTGHGASIGLMIFVFAPAAWWTQRRRAVVHWGIALSVVGLFISLAYASLLPVYQAIPGLAWFRSPERALLLVHLGVAVLAAIGLDTWRRRVRDAVGRQVSRALMASFLALVALEVTLGGALLGALPYDGSWLARYRKSTERFGPLAEAAQGERAVWVGDTPPIALKQASTVGMRWLDDFEPLVLRRHAEYFDWFARGDVSGSGGDFFEGSIVPGQLGLGAEEAAAQAAGLVARRRLLDLAAVRYFVAERSSLEVAATRELLDALVLAPIAYADPGLAVFENPHALPRAYVTHQILPAPATDALLDLLSREDFDPLKSAYVAGHAGLGDPTSPRGTRVHIVEDEATRVVLEVDAEAPGLVVLADAHAAGWRATVDGTRAEIHATNHLFRGVEVAEGIHRVTFAYQTPGLQAGFGLSVLGLVGLLGMGGVVRRFEGVRGPGSANRSGD